MYIKAFLKKDNDIKVFEIKSRCKIKEPQNPFEAWKFSYAIGKLGFGFIGKFLKYSKKGYSLVEVHTDNALVGKLLMDNGFNVIFDPYPEEEMVQSEG